MTAWASERLSAAKAGGVIVLLIVAWVLFLVFPGREGKNESLKVAVSPPGEAELAAVGLRYNVDWIGLPQYFRIWAEKLEWKDDKTWFAYWNAGSNAYSYLFEAIRKQGAYHFRPIEAWEMPSAGSESYRSEDREKVEDVMVKKGEATTHPFVFLRSYSENALPYADFPSRPWSAPDHPEVGVDLQTEKLGPPRNLDTKIFKNEKGR